MRLLKVTTAPFFEYGDTGIHAQIRYVPDGEASETIEKSTEIVYDKKHQKNEKIDNIKFNSKMLKLALVGWKPFARRLMKYLIAPDQALSLDAGETWDDIIDPTPENLELVIKNTHVDFKNFVISAARDAETFIRVNEKMELANLSNTSGGK